MTEKERRIMTQVKELAFLAIKNTVVNPEIHNLEDGFIRVWGIVTRVNMINAEFIEKDKKRGDYTAE